MIESNYTDVNFTIFETRQFNEFMNLQIGKNTIMVSVVKLPTEAPVSQEKRWMTIPEKFLVDLAAEKILRVLIAQSQLDYIHERYLNHYQIDTKKMLRYAGINYTVYFLSRTLEHVLHNRIENLTDQDKTELSEAFDDSYADNLEGFLAFIADKVFAVKGDYKQTWDFIKQDTNSLKRYSNLHLLFEAKKKTNLSVHIIHSYGSA